MKIVSFFFPILFISISSFAQENDFEKFNTDSTKNAQFTSEGFIISENTTTKKFGFIDTLGEVVIPYIFDNVDSFYEGLAPASLNGKYGYINKKAEVVIPMIYSMVTRFINGYAVVYNDYKCGLINVKNDTLLPFEFGMLGGLPDNLIFINSKDMKHYGVILVDKKIILENKFAHIKKFRNKIILTKRNEKWQVRDLFGKLLVNDFFDEVNFYEKEKLIRLKLNNLYGFLDENGKVIIPFEYEQFKGVADGLIPAKKNGKWGFVDTLGNEIITFKYDDLDGFNNGYARVKIEDKYNLVNRNDEFIFPNHFEKINRIYPSYLWSIIEKKDSTLIYNKDLIPISSLYFEWIGYPDFNRIPFKREGKYGFIDSEGKIIIDNKFEEATSFSNGYSIVNLNSKKGFIDTMGNEIIPIIYNKISAYGVKQGILEKDGKFGIYNEAKIVVPVIHEGLKGTQFDRYITTSNNKYGLIDLDNRIILPNEYDEIVDELTGYGCKIRQGTKWGFIQKDAFKITVPVIYDELKAWSNLVLVKIGLKYGLVSDKGKQLIPLEFDRIAPHKEGIKVFKNQKIGLYSLEGELLLFPLYDDINLNRFPKISVSKENNWETFHYSELLNKN